MVRLTEDMVVARSKTSDLESITKLNFWGSDLTDISIVKQFKRAEILSFSLNQITSLSPFQYCKNLQELYIRRNDIRDLREVCYLQDLPKLRRLLLSENPCCETAGDLYRPTIIRALPALEMLDNEEVTPADREYALQLGLILDHPSRRKEQEKIVAGTRYYEGPELGRSSRYLDDLLRHRTSAMDASSHKKISSPPDTPPSARPATASIITPAYQLPSSSPPDHQDQTGRSFCSQSNRPGSHSTARTSASPLLEFYRHDLEKHRCQQSRADPPARPTNSLLDEYTLQHGSSLSSGTTSSRSGKSNKNLVSAAVCLINELDINGLDIVELALKRRYQELSL